MQEGRNRIPKFGLAATLVFFAYGWAVVDPNATGGPVETMGIFGTLLMFVAIVATLATIFIAAWRAHRAGSWRWFLAVVFVWPLSYLYTLGINPRSD